MHCKNCTHWSRTTRNSVMGTCARASHTFLENHTDLSEGMCVRVKRGNLANAWPAGLFIDLDWKEVFEKTEFLTGENFGCIYHHQAGNKKPQISNQQS